MLLALVALILLALASWGWGRALAAACHRGETTPAAYDVALGLACLNVLGGVLNALHLATRAGLLLVALLGVVLAVLALTRLAPSRGAASATRSLPLERAAAGVILLFTAFFAWTLLPASVMNVHDDFQTYLPRPLRMLATGTLGGNAFDALGADGLGTQALFQALFATVLPLADVNAFDAVFCFGTGAFLVLAIARKLALPPGFAAIAVLTFVLFNPQYVNVSPIYSGSVMIAASFLASGFVLEALRREDRRAFRLAAIPLGLFAGTLVGLKATLAPFAPLQLVVLLAAALALRAPWRHLASAAAVTAGAALLAVVPWLIVILPAYLRAQDASVAFAADATLAASHPTIAADALAALFTRKALFYGGSHLQYNAIVAFVLVAGVVAATAVLVAARARHARTAPLASSGALVLGIAAGCLPVAAVYLLNGHLFDPSAAVRYACPILLATFPAAGLAFAHVALAFRKPWPIGAAVAIVTLVVVDGVLLATFAPVFVKRVRQAAVSHTLLAYPFDQKTLDFTVEALGETTAKRVRTIQETIPPGEAALAWMETPFHLDFARNEVSTLSEPGIVNPWLGFPAGASPERLAEYLRALDIRFVVLDVEGHAVKTPKKIAPLRRSPFPLYRKLADYGIHARRALLDLAKTKTVVYRDDRTVVLDLGGPSGGGATQGRLSGGASRTS
ncbi:MAG: hypothetical protein FJ144_21575 [Deltaproteobacteria bacterium]|nr:hypothetical protein [Deltaproteobacteria bacterium]